MSRLQGKVAVITGGSSGIGLATAQRFVREGAFVYIFGRRQSELDQAAALIGQRVATVRGDVQSIRDLDRLYARIREEKGSIDVLVANSGFIDPQSLVDTTEVNFDKTFGTNVRGLLFTVQKALPLISDGGAIVLISSIAAFKGISNYTSYSATKAAVRSFVRTWTAELKDSGIRVNAISPGAIDTPIIDAQSATKEGADAIRASFKAATPLSRLGRPEEIAAAALFLASDEGSYVAGADLVVDGGLSAL
ncbi:NAD(P)-dependent dehydrogenase, short-chain alcohol dehydrogenase family [Bradyrhizobium erythrophlei]|jgi:NAD(P)-dependent dehydrogenase (short-subunit alcohol dehydrogenase family)|nr:NAD(P)-dependent dehydrogenase, short-chain alcohol dehydrogenase family [Bradyrhizobium erythrophlei]